MTSIFEIQRMPKGILGSEEIILSKQILHSLFNLNLSIELILNSKVATVRDYLLSFWV